MKIKTPQQQLRDAILELEASIGFLQASITKNKKLIEYKDSAFLSLFVFRCKEDLYYEIEQFRDIVKDLSDYKEMLEDKLLNI